MRTRARVYYVYITPLLLTSPLPGKRIYLCIIICILRTHEIAIILQRLDVHLPMFLYIYT